MNFFGVAQRARQRGVKPRFVSVSYLIEGIHHGGGMGFGKNVVRGLAADKINRRDTQRRIASRNDPPVDGKYEIFAFAECGMEIGAY